MLFAKRIRPQVLLIETGLRMEDGMRTVDVLECLASEPTTGLRIIVLESRNNSLTGDQRDSFGIDRYLADEEVTPAKIVDAVQSFTNTDESDSAALANI